jgi:hypothetical protein
MKKLLITQFYTPNLDYAIKSEEINKKYCEKFNIDYFSQTNKEIINSGKDDRAFTWYKIPLLIEQLKKNEHEYVMYMDADAVFVKNDYNIIDIIDQNKEFDFICSGDFGPDVINGGVLIFKNTEWSLNFLERVWDSANYISRGKYKLEVWHEQTIISAFMLINQQDRLKTKILSHYDDNAINDHILRIGKTLIYHDLSKIRISEIHKLNNGDYDIITELNLTCNSDRHVGHGYANFYKEFIETHSNNDKIINILDIGGDSGVLFNIFLKYYPNIRYFNITQNDYEIENDKINKIIINSINEDTLKNFIEKNENKFDLIIADYAHTCYIRDLLFSLFFDKLNDNGLFVIEDLQTDLEIKIPEKNNQYGWGDPTKKSMTDLINQFKIDGSFDSDYVDFKDLNTKIKDTEIYKSLPFSSLLGLIYKK